MTHVLGSRKRSGVAAVVVALVMAMMIAACGGSSSKSPASGPSGSSGSSSALGPDGIKVDTAKPVEGGSMTMALDAESTGGWCLPEAQLAIAGIQVARALYDYITVPDNKGGYVPSLATAVTPNKDYTSWTIQVRPGITFSDGSALTAKVVKDNLDAYRGALKPIRNPLLFVFVFDYIKDVTTTGPMTVKVDMTKPWASFPAHLYEYGRLGIMGERQLRDSKGTCFKDLVGTGPFMLKSWVPNNHLIAVKNPHYWRKDQYGQQLPYLDQITFTPQPDPSGMENGLLSKEFDLATTDDTTTVIPGIQSAIKSGTMNIAEAPQNPEIGYTIFNTQKPPFNNILARQAYAYAYNRVLYNKLRQDDLNVIGNGPFGPGVLGYLADTGLPDYNLQKAKDLVAQYKSTTHQDFSFTLSIPNDSASQQSANVVRGFMEAAGMTMTLKPEEQSQQINDVIYGSYQAAAWRNHPGFDPDTQWVWWHCDAKPAANAPTDTNIGVSTPLGSVGNNCDNLVNFSKFNDPVINADLEKGRGSTDPAVRKAAYEDLNKEFAKQVWEAWGYFSLWTMPYQTNVHGILGPPLPTPTDANVSAASPLPYTGLSSGTDVSGLWKS